MGNLDFLSIDAGSLIFTIINTLILFFVIKHFLFGRVNKILEERQNDISSAYQKADETMENAKKLESDYNELMADAKEKSAEIIKTASLKATKRSDEIIAQAKSEAVNITAKANDDIEREKKRARSQLKNEISEIAVQIAGKVVEKEISANDQKRLIDEFIENAGEQQ